MADPTACKFIEEEVHQMKKRVEDLNIKSENDFSTEQNQPPEHRLQRIEWFCREISRKNDLLINMMQSLNKDQIKSSGSNEIQFHSQSSISTEKGSYRDQSVFFQPSCYEIKFPVYKGNENPYRWIRECTRRHQCCRIPESEKVFYGAFHLEDDAINWYYSTYQSGEEPTEWREFVLALCERFVDRSDVVEDFHKLEQVADLKEYNLKFLDLRCVMSIIYPYMTEQYFILSYIAGLKEEIRGFVRCKRRSILSLDDAFQCSKEQKMYIQALYRFRITEEEFDNEADNAIHFMFKKLAKQGKSLQTYYDNGVLTVKLIRRSGTFVINKETPSRQIGLSSPISGSSRFDFDDDSNSWINRRTKADLFQLLQKEIRELL